MSNLSDMDGQAEGLDCAAKRQAEIDAAFAEMANDSEYLAEAMKMDTEFALASWEALQLGEKSE